MSNRCANVGWSIGSYCNAQCNHCYSWKNRENNSNILTHEEVEIIIEKLISYNVETVNFGGNEPIFTCGSDLTQTMLPFIIKRLHNAHIKCGITTNGFTMLYLFRHHFQEFMMVNDWDFSLDSPCRELHDKNRNCKGLYDSVIKAITLCKHYKKPCSIVIAGMKSNLDKTSLDGFIALAKHYNTELRINLLRPTQLEHFALFPTKEQVYTAYSYLSKNMDFISLSEPAIAAQLNVATTGCPCGTNSFRIRAKVGSRVPVTPCVYLDYDAGDILTQSIDEIVHSSVFKEFNRRKEQLPANCKSLNCDLIEQCRGGCAARTILVTNNPDETDPYCIYSGNQCSELSGNAITLKKSSDEHIRVHENYLCTWIGRPKAE